MSPPERCPLCNFLRSGYPCPITGGEHPAAAQRDIGFEPISQRGTTASRIEEAHELLDRPRAAIVVQQPPGLNNGSRSIWQLVVEDIELLFPAGYLGVANDLRLRAAFGKRKYGVVLQANNGRHPLIGAYQEALDGAQYLRQAVEEGYPVEGLYRESLRHIIALRAQLTALEIP